MEKGGYARHVRREEGTMYNTRSSTNRCMRILCTALVMLPSIAVAQPVDIARVAPEDALLLVGSSGCENMKAAKSGTAMGKTLADPQVSAFVDKVWSVVDQLIKEQAEGAGMMPAYQAGKGVLENFFTKPTALVVLDFGFGPMGPGVSAAIVCEVGADGPEMLGAINSLIGAIGLPMPGEVDIDGLTVHQLFVPVPGGLYYTMIGDHFVFASGPQTITILSKVLKGETANLSSSSVLRSCREKIGGTDSTRHCSLFVNVTKVHERIQMLMPMFTGGDPQAQAWFDGFMESSGYGGIKAYCAEMHHRNGGCQTGVYVTTDGPPKGFLSAYTGDPVSEDVLAIVPKDVSWASVARLCPTKMYDAYLGMIVASMPGAPMDVKAMIAEQEAEIGVRIREDLLGAIGDTFVMFDKPGEGFLFTGITLCAKVKDGARLTESMKKLVSFVQREVADEEATLALHTSEYRGHAVHTLSVVGFPIPLAPAWSFHGDWMVVGLFPQMLYAQLDRMIDGNPRESSLLANEQFVRGRAAVGAFGSMVGYNDSKLAADSLYAIALPALQAGIAMAQGEGIAVNIADVPSRHALTQHLFADVYTGGADETGMYYKSHGPLPVPIPAIGGSTAGLAIAGLLASIVVPSVQKARSQAKQAVCAANLTGIGVACQIYAADHNGAFPASLNTLIEEGVLTAEQIQCRIPDGTPVLICMCRAIRARAVIPPMWLPTTVKGPTTGKAATCCSSTGMSSS